MYGGLVSERRRYARSTSSGEKQIDAKLVADATATAITVPMDQRTTIAFVTGDANVVPALKKIVKQEGWTIEIYMLDQAISKSLLDFANDPAHTSRVNIIRLDDHLDEISFSQNELDVALKVGPGKKNFRQWKHRLLAKPYSVVFTMPPGAFPNKVVSREWVENLEKVTRWPLQHYWFMIENKKTDDLIVIFQRDKKAGIDFDLDHFMSERDEILKMPNMHALSMQTFREFISRRHCLQPAEELKMWDDVLEHCYNDDSLNEGCHATDSDSSSISDTSDFIQVKRKLPKSKQRYTKWCPFRKNCINGTRCHNRHTEDDKSYFRKRKDGRGNPGRKTSLCDHFERKSCIKSKEECEYAHGESDGWCTNCRYNGHFAINCKKPRRDSTEVA